MKPIIFFRVAWMIHYEGVTKTDKPNGAGTHIEVNRDGGEVTNFLPVGDNLYGYARMRKAQDLRIQRLGASIDDEYLDDVTIVFFATNPNVGGQYVVGWYDNARLYRSLQSLGKGKRKDHPNYLAYTKKKDGTLLPVELRKFDIPDDGPGQTNVWYVQEYAKANSFLEKFYKFKNAPAAYRKKEKKANNKKAWLLDADKRKNIEVAAMHAVEDYFINKGFEVKYVHLDKVGWDLEASKGKQKFLLEVKGTSLSLDSVLLTPNEYGHSTNKSNYRVCILENALNKAAARLHVCRLSENGKHWISESGEHLLIVEIRSAQLKKVEN